MRKLTCRRGEQLTLSGLPVGSNSTGLVHSEEMLDLGGGFSLLDAGGTCRLVNRSALNLHGVGLLRKDSSGEYQEAWIGEVPAAEAAGTSSRTQPAAEVPVRWHDSSPSDADTPLWSRQRDASPISKSNPPAGILNVRRLLEIGQNPADLGDGEVRLIGWSNDNLPGLSIEPASPQAKRGIVVIAHLRYGFGDAPRPDKNLRIPLLPELSNP